MGNRYSAYHVQQAVEKITKALLLARGIEAGIEHRLEELFKRFPAEDECLRRLLPLVGYSATRRRAAIRRLVVVFPSTHQQMRFDATLHLFATSLSWLENNFLVRPPIAESLDSSARRPLGLRVAARQLQSSTRNATAERSPFASPSTSHSRGHGRSIAARWAVIPKMLASEGRIRLRRSQASAA